jgi:hypothetical protein
MPELTLERAMSVAREGPPARALPLLDSLAKAWPPARFTLAEVQFFAGQLDSAHANYERVAAVPGDDDAAAALDRMYLLEESPSSPVRAMLAQIEYERWRNRDAVALTLADSLWRAQAPRGARARAGWNWPRCGWRPAMRGALVPLLVVCDSLAEDRLAPTAAAGRQAYMALGDAKHARPIRMPARYPRAWNWRKCAAGSSGCEGAVEDPCGVARGAAHVPALLAQPSSGADGRCAGQPSRAYGLTFWILQRGEKCGGC